MSDIMIEFADVWKKFRRGERHDSLRDLVPAMAKRIFRRGTPSDLETEEFWALKDVSFEVKRGEALGIIGPNGAGKSTTLKLLNRILRPTRGSCRLRGRVGALIEVAAGFHPDLTGRENVFLQGAIMGMRRTEIAARLDEIIDFAGVAEFVDTPVKRYSSGMNARLGFSVAAHLEPDVLIIDEVLSVGDMAFQRRCVERMEEFRRSGVAIAFVSHDMASISKLCANALFLNRGIVAAGPTADVIRRYATAATQAESQPDSEMIIESARLLEQKTNALTITPGTPLTLSLNYRANRSISGGITFGVILRRTSDLLVVYDGNFTSNELGLDGLAEGTRFGIDFPLRAHLLRGQYHFECHVYHNPTQRFLSTVGPVGSLTVQETRTFAGVADLEIVPKVRRSPQPTISVSTMESPIGVVGATSGSR
jgi:ABC-type polysaccharide/polyol phosphate transport system ATPase subunit